ncbi:MAG: futalosine hydrolase, partial [Stackebrandtia sp.]
VGTAAVAAELGVALENRFLPLDELGFGSATIACLPGLTAGVTGTRGTILTLATITGTTRRADELARGHPRAVAEAMEGFGVATAAAQANLPFAEIRAISNAVADRDVTGWDWRGGFAALSTAVSQLPGEEKQ